MFPRKGTRFKACECARVLCRDDVAVKTCWGMAEAAGFERPRPFQSLMSVNEWDGDGLWEAVASRHLVCPSGDPLGPGIAVDETV